MLHDAIYELYEDACIYWRRYCSKNTDISFDENGDAITIVADDVTAKITELENADN